MAWQVTGQSDTRLVRNTYAYPFNDTCADDWQHESGNHNGNFPGNPHGGIRAHAFVSGQHPQQVCCHLFSGFIPTACHTSAVSPE